jgi:hypothetical protein
MPTGADVTAPAPAPTVETDTAWVTGAAAAKVAVTLCAADTVSAHGPMPEQPPPLQPANWLPGSGIAVSVTAVPVWNVGAQPALLMPQDMPPGFTLTVPRPVPTIAIATVWVAG